jgi:hypothetical protein
MNPAPKTGRVRHLVYNFPQCTHPPMFTSATGAYTLCYRRCYGRSDLCIQLLFTASAGRAEPTSSQQESL